MAAPAVLNAGAGADAGRAAAAGADPVALSSDLLGAARDARDEPGRRAHRDQLAARLRALAPERIDGDAARIAFWVNVYNALLLHRLQRRPLRGSVLRHPRLFDGVAYEVGGRPYTLNVVEHGILRRNRRAPLHVRAALRHDDPRIAAAPSRLDLRIHFVLNCGARSCPPIRAYDAAGLDAQLELATRAYLEAESVLDRDRRRVRLPRLIRLYRRDFGGRERQLDFAARRLPELLVWLQECGAGRVRVGYGRFDWGVADERG